MKTTLRKEQGGVPKGGATSDVLTKNSSTDYDEDFLPPGAGGSGLYNVTADEAVTTWFTSTIIQPMGGTQHPWSGTWGVPVMSGDWGSIGLQNHAGNTTGDLSTAFFYTSGKQLRVKWVMKGNQTNAHTNYSIVIGNVGLSFRGWIFGDTVMHFIVGATDIPLSTTYLNAQHLYELVWDTVNVTLYIDGTNVASTTVAYPGTNPSISFNLQNDPAGGGDSTMTLLSQFIVSREL